MKVQPEHKHLRITHADGKFGVARLANDDHNLHDDEPVFVFRGSDRYMRHVMERYQELCMADDKCSTAHLQELTNNIKRVEQWQADNLEKVRSPGRTRG